MPTDTFLPVPGLRTLLESAFVITQLIAAGILIGLAMRMPRRLNASRAGESTSSEALSQDAGESPVRKRRQRAEAWGLLAAVITVLIALALTRTWSLLPMLTIGCGSLMFAREVVTFLDKTQALHRAHQAADETVASAVGAGILTGVIALTFAVSSANLLPALAFVATAVVLLKLSFTIGSSGMFAGALLLPAFGILMVWDHPSAATLSSSSAVSPALINSASVLILTGLGIVLRVLSRAPADPAPLHPDLRRGARRLS